MPRHRSGLFLSVDKTKARTGAGFTLVEVLVVGAILVILASLLAPAIGKMQKRAATVTCASNLRQLGSAFFLYAGENNGCLPPVRVNSQPGWQSAIWPYVYAGQGPSWPGNCAQVDSQWKTAPDRKKNIFNCPVMYAGRSVPVPGTVLSPSGYSYALSGEVNGFDVPTPLTKVSNPAATAMVLESSYGITGRWYFWENFGMIPHNEACNVLFYDGHIDCRKLKDISKSSSDVFWRGTAE